MKFILDNATDALPAMLLDIPKDREEGTSSSAIEPASEENVVTKMPVGNITPSPNTDEPAEKKGHTTETACTDEEASDPNVKKQKRE